MTLTELAKKHNLDPESAIAFLRDVLDAQPTYWIYEIHGSGGVYQGCTGKDAQSVVTKVSESFPESGKPFSLIARPTLGE